MKTNRILLETILIIGISLLGMWLLPSVKTLFALTPAAYLLLERRLRQRSWQELGFIIRTFRVDLKANWAIFIILGFVIQPAIVIWAKTGFPPIWPIFSPDCPLKPGSVGVFCCRCWPFR